MVRSIPLNCARLSSFFRQDERQAMIDGSASVCRGGGHGANGRVPGGARKLRQLVLQLAQLAPPWAAPSREPPLVWLPRR